MLFTKTVSECENHFERWIYVLKNMEKLDRYPFEIKDKVFKKLIETCEVSSWTREERIKYDHALKQFRDTLAVMEGHMSDEERFSEDRLNDVWCKTYSSILSLVAFKLMQQACHVEKECAIVPFNLSDYLIEEYYEASGY